MGPEEHTRLTAIEPGIPPYMKPQVCDWIMKRSSQANGWFDSDVPKFMSLAFKREFSSREDYFQRQIDSLDGNELVSALDWLLYFDIHGAKYQAENLKMVLDMGRSEWTVSLLERDAPRLAKRIPSGVEAAYEDIVSKTAAAGNLLAQAFNAVYGANPNSDSAYGLSVKAVETLACPKYLAANTRATLGSVIAHLSQKDVRLPLLEGNVSDRDLVVSMMRKLWAGGERHGSETYQHVSLDGAKVALALAFSLVSLLHEDVITVA
jgi:hypothetical protein